MPRTISLDMRRALFAESSDEVMVLLVTITHQDLPAPLRMSSDDALRISVDPLAYGTRSRGNLYYFLPFSMVLPDDKEDAPPAGRLQIDNIDRQLIPILRSTDIPAQAMLEIVLASNPDYVEIVYPQLEITSISYDMTSIQIDMTIEALLNEPFPADTFNPSTFPGLF